MRKLSFILSIVLVFVFLFTAVNAAQVKAAKFTWKLALEEIEGSMQDTWAKEFKKRIEDKSNGEIEIQLYPYGTLGSGFGDIAEACQTGVLEMSFTTPAYVAPVIPAARVFSLHYLWSRDIEANQYVLSHSDAIYEDLAGEFADKNLHLMSMFTEGWQVWTTKKTITKPADFKGVKFRVMSDPLLLEVYKNYGANPVQIAYSEIYSALQLNMLDAQVQPNFANQEMKFYEQVDYLIFPEQLPYIAGVSANKQWFDSLPEKYQDMIMETCREISPWMAEQRVKLNKERLEMMLEAKPSLETIYLTNEQREAFRELALPVWDKYVRDVGEVGEKILNKLVEDIEAAEKN